MVSARVVVEDSNKREVGAERTIVASVRWTSLESGVVYLPEKLPFPMTMTYNPSRSVLTLELDSYFSSGESP